MGCPKHPRADNRRFRGKIMCCMCAERKQTKAHKGETMRVQTKASLLEGKKLVENYFQCVRFQRTRESSYEYGIAKVKAFGMSDVEWIVTMDGKRVDGDVWNYWLGQRHPSWPVLDRHGVQVRRTQTLCDECQREIPPSSPIVRGTFSSNNNVVGFESFELCSDMACLLNALEHIRQKQKEFCATVADALKGK